jgi:serine/threonine protein phosphatase 1
MITHNTNMQRCRSRTGLRIYAIGDIHGMIELAAQMFNLIDEETANWNGEVIVVTLGDYIDRGPDSNAVLELLVRRSELQGTKLVTLRGNHEDILLRFLDEPEHYGHDWMQLGGAATIFSYGAGYTCKLANYGRVRRELARRLPLRHLAFLQALPLSFQSEEFFFSHAGARPGIPLEEQARQDLLWMRWNGIRPTIAFEKVLVHGHTPVAEPTIDGFRINVDTGAYASGRLSAARITPDGVSFLTVTSPTASQPPLAN